MARETVTIGCRLPNGIILTHPENKDLAVRLAGTSGERMENGFYMPPRLFSTTQVDAEFWAAWKKEYEGYPPLKTRAIFEAKNESEAAEKAKEVAKVRTGFEQMSQTPVIDGVKLEKAVS